MASNLELKVVLSAIDKMTGPMRGIAQQSKRLSVGYRGDMKGYNDTLKQTEKALEGVRDTQRRMIAAGNHNIGSSLKAEDSLVRKIHDTNAAIEHRKALMTQEMDIIRRRQAAIDRGQKQMMRGSMQMASAAAATYAGAKFMMPGFDFEEEMSKVQALTRLEKDDPRFNALKEQAKYLGASTWASSTEAAQGQSFYAMAGYDPEAIMKAMPSTLDLARAGGVDVGRAADINSNILSAFGMDPTQSTEVADILVGVFTRTNTSIESLGETMKYFGTIAGAVDIPLEEAAALAGILGNVGIQGSQAGTSLKTITSNLSAPMGKTLKALEELQVSTKDDNGDLRSMPDMLSDIIKATEGMGSADRMRILTHIAGKEAAAGFSAMIDKKGYGEFLSIVEAAAEAHKNGEAAKVAKIMADNVKGDWEELTSAIESVQIETAEAANKPLRDLLQTVTQITEKVSGWIKDNPKLASAIMKVTMTIIGITAVIGALTFAMGVLNLVVLANPIVLVITAIIAAIILLIAYKDEIWDFFGSFSKAPGEHALKGIGFISALGNKISNFLNDIPVIGPILRGIFEVSLIPLKMIKLLWTGVIKGLQWIGDNWGEIVGWFEMMWSGIIVTMQPITQSIQGIWDTIKIGISITKAAFTALWNSVSEQMQPVVDIFNIIIEAISEMINGIKEFFSFETPGWISAIGDNIAGGFDYLMGNDVIEHKVTPAMISGASIVAANPVNNNQTNNNNVAINITTETNASPGVIAGAVVNQLHSSGLIGDLR